MYRTLTNSSGTFGHLLGGCVDGLDQEADARLDLGRGALERGQRLPIAAGLTCRVGDAPMDRRRRARELWADLSHSVAEADHVVEALTRELVQVLGAPLGNVQAACAHHPHGVRVKWLGIAACA